jgi:Ser/Thr protein kinase RdoA (MazF antagonist)
MLNRPDNLPDEALIDALRSDWRLSLDADSLEYLPVGFGSNHWLATDLDRSSWFLTVDTVGSGASFARLRTALETARAVADTGAAFVVAPIRTEHGDVLVRVGNTFAAALYPYVEGRRPVFGEVLGMPERQLITGTLATLHATPDAF